MNLVNIQPVVNELLEAVLDENIKMVELLTAALNAITENNITIVEASKHKIEVKETPVTYNWVTDKLNEMYVETYVETEE
jgi:hypothetical protein